MGLAGLFNFLLSLFTSAGTVPVPAPSSSQASIPEVVLTRLSSGDDGTFGEIYTHSGARYSTGELPWHDDKPDVSCIPLGEYLVEWAFSEKHGMCYHIRNVLRRSNVEIHAANWFGDVSKGLKCQLLGCIAIGLSTGILEGQKAVISSDIGLSRFEADMSRAPFKLSIKGIVG